MKKRNDVSETISDRDARDLASRRPQRYVADRREIDQRKASEDQRRKAGRS